MTTCIRMASVMAVALAGCAIDESMETGEENVDMFDDTGTPSATFQQLMGKRDAITSDGIAGVYESTGTGSGYYLGADDETHTATIRWTYRVELRRDQVATAMRCDVTYSESWRLPASLLPFVAQRAMAASDSYVIVNPGFRSDTDPVSQTVCKIEQTAAAWAYCVSNEYSVSLPSGATTCIGRRDHELVMVTARSGDSSELRSMGLKVAN